MENCKNNTTKRGLGGFYKLPHTIFEEPAVKELTGEQFRLYLWLTMRAWRFPFSDGTVRASLTYIQRYLPISESTASRALKKLQNYGLIRLIEKNFHDGNLWFVVRHLFDFTSEKKAFQALQSKLGASKLEKIFQVLQKKGTPSGRTCICPLSYLNKLPLPALENICWSENDSQDHEYIAAKAEVSMSLQDAGERAFAQAFPSVQQQEAYFEGIRQQFPFAPSGSKILKLLAIATWSKEN